MLVPPVKRMQHQLNEPDEFGAIPQISPSKKMVLSTVENPKINLAHRA